MHVKVTLLCKLSSHGGLLALGGRARDTFTGLTTFLSLEGHLSLRSYLGEEVLEVGLAPGMFLWVPCSLFYKLPFGYVCLSVFRFLKV